MRARRERAVAHAALKRVAIIYAREGQWTPACVDLWRVAVDCTKPRPSWTSRVARRAGARWGWMA